MSIHSGLGKVLSPSIAYVTVLSVENGAQTTAGTAQNRPMIAGLAEEEHRIRQLRLLADVTTAVLKTRPLSRHEAVQVVDELRRRVLTLFPDKGPVFDLIYEPRFRRIIRERLGDEGG